MDYASCNYANRTRCTQRSSVIFARQDGTVAARCTRHAPLTWDAMPAHGIIDLVWLTTDGRPPLSVRRRQARRPIAIVSNSGDLSSFARQQSRWATDQDFGRQLSAPVGAA